MELNIYASGLYYAAKSELGKPYNPSEIDLLVDEILRLTPPPSEAGAASVLVSAQKALEISPGSKAQKRLFNCDDDLRLAVMCRSLARATVRESRSPLTEFSAAAAAAALFGVRSSLPAQSAAWRLDRAMDALLQRAKSRDTDDGERSMLRTVEIFSRGTAYDKKLSELQGWFFMICLKLARARQGAHHSDDYVDLCGYIALLAECYIQTKDGGGK